MKMTCQIHSDTGDDVKTLMAYRRLGEEAQLLETVSSQEENICCQSQSSLEEKIEECSSICITSHEGFIANFLNIHVLET
ncbi:hypothetical protein ACJMK2_043486 [Sinanodonta woodiana]|uniref:Uncharacterized protein n=1 Tax=Sinanodonta woodiana TaxID=1069815 RepID=A0ABD3W081_SINWO